MLEIIFFTSSSIKLAHARYLCRGYNIKIVGFHEKTYHANYEEPRIWDREQILEQSYQSALKQAKKAGINADSHFFIMEDTSVIIDALSEEREFPGVDIKYWMQDTSFAEVNEALIKKNNNRAVTVRSDLILHLPMQVRKHTGGKPYIRFTSQQDGSIVSKESNIKIKPAHPWLDNKTFN